MVAPTLLPVIVPEIPLMTVALAKLSLVGCAHATLTIRPSKTGKHSFAKPALRKLAPPAYTLSRGCELRTAIVARARGVTLAHGLVHGLPGLVAGSFALPRGKERPPSREGAKREH